MFRRSFWWINLAETGVLDGAVDQGGDASDFGEFYLGSGFWFGFFRDWFDEFRCVNGILGGRRFVVKVIAEAAQQKRQLVLLDAFQR